MEKTTRFNMLYAFLAIVGVFVLHDVWVSYQTVTTLPYSELQKHAVKFSGHIESKLFATLLSWILPVLLFFGIWMLIMRRMSGRLGAGGGLMSITPPRSTT
jgi:ATP-dependent Zn protease